MRASEMRELDSADLHNRLELAKKELFNLKLNFRTNTLEDPGQIRILRKDMARLLTVLRERDLAAALVEAEHGVSDETSEEK
jgi:large subunit ribosomal protein L29